MLRSVIRRSGDATVEFDPEKFCLTDRDQRTLMLNNLYDEYGTIPHEHRSELLSAWTTTWSRNPEVIPDEFADARGDLFPKIICRGTAECDFLECRIGGASTLLTPHETLGEHFVIELVYDLPESMVGIRQEQLTKWGVSFEQALESARQNVLQTSQNEMFQLFPGVWISPWQDNYDATRILLPELIRRCEVQGDHVVMIPNRCVLIITGADDSAGLAQMATMAEEAYNQPRFLSGIPLCLKNGHWVPFLLPDEHVCSKRFRALRMITWASDYARQGDLLRTEYERRGEDVFVASAFCGKEPDLGTISVWPKDVDTLLPVTQYVSFCWSTPQGTASMVICDWQVAVEIVGERMEPLGIYPERFRVRSFPTESELEAMDSPGEQRTVPSGTPEAKPGRTIGAAGRHSDSENSASNKPWTTLLDEHRRLFPTDRKLSLQERMAAVGDRIRNDRFADLETKRRDLTRLEAEGSWVKAGKPYYNVHPQLVPKICRTNLDAIPASFIEVPNLFPAVNLRFADRHQEIGNAAGVLFSRSDDGFALVADTGRCYSVDGCRLGVCVTFQLQFHDEETIPQAYARILKDVEGKAQMGADEDGPLRHFLVEGLQGWYLNIFRLMATVGFLANCEDDLLQCDVLSRDRRAYAEALANDDVPQQDRIVQRAIRRGKHGWNIGTNEMFAGEYPPQPQQPGDKTKAEHKWAHIRSGHPHAVRYGPGRKYVKIKWFRPTVVRPDLKFKPS